MHECCDLWFLADLVPLRSSAHSGSSREARKLADAIVVVVNGVARVNGKGKRCEHNDAMQHDEQPKGWRADAVPAAIVKQQHRDGEKGRAGPYVSTTDIFTKSTRTPASRGLQMTLAILKYSPPQMTSSTGPIQAAVL